MLWKVFNVASGLFLCFNVCFDTKNNLSENILFIKYNQ